jgi:CheY-like chemotaxis protein
MILIVDDDPRFLQQAEAILGQREPVYFARDLKGALELLATVGSTFSVALVDLDLDGGNGAGTIRGIRQVAPGLPIIAVSGAAQQDVLESARAAGADESLRKPVSAEWLATIARLRAAH